MKIRLPNTARLHALRMENTQTGYDMEEQRERFARLENRAENGAAPRAVSAYQLFQTPPELAARLVEMLALEEGARVLEPSAGLGRLLDALEPIRPAEVVAIEVAPQCAGELFTQSRERVKIMQRDFLTVEPQETGHFDAVVMNPPFHMRSDIKHIRHALDFLKPGGRLAAIMMDTPHRHAAFKEEAVEWISLPPGTFKSAATDVPTILAVFRA